VLCKYLNIESLRMEGRLSVNWQMNTMPGHVLLPPLILQPLVENAVYHGIEPIPQGGEITVAITQKANEVRFSISNPSHAGA
jgi:two-component system sensor histidine kinase AlgZ|tara:strand:+ start:48864 stop:49109 length:246 start_codon:yes stop_codon:yes gene_type:complete